MNKWIKKLAAALCAAVLMCGMAVTAYKAIHRPADRAQGQVAVRAGTDDDRQLQLFSILHIKKQSVHYRILRSYKDTLHGPSDRIRTCGILLPNF